MPRWWYWEIGPARPATNPFPFFEHRTLAAVQRTEQKREQLTNKLRNIMRQSDSPPDVPA